MLTAARLTAARVCLAVASLAAVSAWPQAGTNTSEGGDSSSSYSTGMQIPPPVSGTAYPTELLSEARSNYLRTGLLLTSSYVDNVLQNTSGTPTGDTYYSIVPTITLDHTAPRLHQTLTYSPGFTFYQHTTSLNEVDHN